MAKVKIDWDKKKLGLFIGNCDEAEELITDACRDIASTANLMAGDMTGERYGGYPDGGILDHPQQPEYDYNVKKGPSHYSWVGFVHADNAAAAADAVKNNTLAKAL